jgi:hypothetical protein
MRAKRLHTQRLRQNWLRDFENVVLTLAPSMRQRADFWDTAIHLFNQGLAPARAAQQWLNTTYRQHQEERE